MRDAKSNKSKLQADSLAKKLLQSNSRRFWAEVTKITQPYSTAPSAAVGNASGPEEIASLWQQHFKHLLNSSTDTTSNPLLLML